MTAPADDCLTLPLSRSAPWVRIVRDKRHAIATNRPAVRAPRDAYKLLAPMLDAEEVEVFVLVCLDVHHHVIALAEVTRGILDASLVHPREVFRLAIAANAAACIVAHNHPSGDPTPSAEDRTVTDQLVKAGRLLDIPVHDHIVIGNGRYTSFAEAGLL